MNVLSPSKYLQVPHSPFLWWGEMITCPRDEMKWGEWCRRCDRVWGCYWPSEDSSGGSSASRLDDYGTRKPQKVKPGMESGAGGGCYCMLVEIARSWEWEAPGPLEKKMWCFVLFPSFLLLFKAWHPLLSVTIKKTKWLCNLEVLYHSLSSPIGDRPPSNLSKKHLKEHCPARTSRSSGTGLHFSSVELV